MLASRSTGLGTSSSSTIKPLGVSNSTKHTKDSFFVYSYKKMMSIFTMIWGKTRKSLWVLSTGFILLVLPFTFAYISQFQKQAAKILGTNQGGFL